jgi:hypothetical protein
MCAHLHAVGSFTDSSHGCLFVFALTRARHSRLAFCYLIAIALLQAIGSVLACQCMIKSPVVPSSLVAWLMFVCKRDGLRQSLAPQQREAGGTGGRGRRGGRRLEPRRATLEPPSHMWGPFRMTYKPGKSSHSWQITCPFHDVRCKTKCTRTRTVPAGSNRRMDQMVQLRLYLWGVRALVHTTRTR